MITKKILQEMVRKQLNEMTQDVLADVPQEQLDLLTDDERNRLVDLLTKKNVEDMYLTAPEKDELLAMQRAVVARSREADRGTALDPVQVGDKALAAREKTLPAALKSLGRDPDEELGVDPFAKTQSAGSLADTTTVVPRLRRENKIITQSRLRQLIKEELEVILTDDEVKEMFGIDITEEKEGSVKIKI
jgi:hypothetical protein